MWKPQKEVILICVVFCLAQFMQLQKQCTDSFFRTQKKTVCTEVVLQLLYLHKSLFCWPIFPNPKVDGTLQKKEAQCARKPNHSNQYFKSLFFIFCCVLFRFQFFFSVLKYALCSLIKVDEVKITTPFFAPFSLCKWFKDCAKLNGA